MEKKKTESHLLGMLIAAACLLFSGCEKETTLHSGLEERQANLVMAALLDEGIECHKIPGEEGTWNVMVQESKFAAAVNLLERKGLPRRAHQGIGEVFKKTGMISSPSEERIRFMDALAQDLSRTISGIDGVIDARVHVVLPENDPFARNALPSSAAVPSRGSSSTSASQRARARAGCPCRMNIHTAVSRNCRSSVLIVSWADCRGRWSP